MAGIFYASREDVAQALDTKAAAYASAQIDRAIDSASRNVEGLCHRVFYPTLATRYFDFPNEQGARSGRLWLDENELASLTTFASGGTVIPPSAYFLEPVNSGPPYTSVNVNRGLSYTLNSGPTTPQQSLALTGVWCGSPLDEGSAGTLAAAITSSQTTITVTSANVGVGRVLRIDSERLIVTDKSFIASAQTPLVALTANANNNALSVTDGTQFRPREEVIIDSERMLIVEIIGNTLTVKRATGGSTLAAHATSAPIFFARQLTVTRGALGTTAAAHLISAPIARHLVPALIEQLTVAYALARGLNEASGYARVIGQGDSQASATIQRGIGDLEANVLQRHGRQLRTYAV